MPSFPRATANRTFVCRILLIFIIALAGACGQTPTAEQAAAEWTKAPAEWLTMSDGYRLPMARWLPDEPPCRVVLGLHGFNDLHLAFIDLATQLSEGCTAFYAYDQRGFGANEDRGIWAGGEQLAADAVSVAGMLRERHPEIPLFLAGESMGAAVAIRALTGEDAPEVAGAVLLAPAVWAREIQPWYTRLGLWLGTSLAPGLRLSREWIGLRPSNDAEVLRYWDTHPLVIRRTRVDALAGVTDLMDAALAAAGRFDERALVLYGGNDEIIPRDAMCALVKKLPGAPAGRWRFAYYPRGYHLLSRGDGTALVRRDIAAWLDSVETPLPSGRGMGPEEARTFLCEEPQGNGTDEVAGNE